MIEISILKEEEKEELNDYINKKDSTIYHTLEWADIIKIFGHNLIYLIAKEDNLIKGVLPLYYVKGFFGKRLVSVSLRDRGGPLYDNEEILKLLLERAKEICKEKNCKYIEIKLLEELPPFVEEIGFVKDSSLINTFIDINKDKEVIWKSMDKGSVRSAIKRSEKLGVNIKDETNLKGIKEFYNVFLGTRKKHGTPPHPLKFFKLMFDKFKDENRIKILLAEYNEKAIGGMILLLYKGRIIYAYGAADSNYLHFKPYNSMIWSAIDLGIKNGYTYFDFGADLSSAESLISFKSRWGGFQKKIPYYYYLNGINEIPKMDFIGEEKYGIVKKIWKIIPTPISRVIGKYLVKQMS